MSQLRDYERESIRAFVQSAADAGYLSGRVLDYGCGKQPYRDIVEAAGGNYFPFDHPDLPASVASEPYNARPPSLKGLVDDLWLPEVEDMHDFDAVLCTQVLQYVPRPQERIEGFKLHLSDGGVLVLTYPTNWPEVEDEDLHRFTKAGMERMLTEAGFTIVEHEPRVWVYATAAIIPTPGGKQGPIDDAGTAFALGYGVIARA